MTEDEKDDCVAQYEGGELSKTKDCSLLTVKEELIAPTAWKGMVLSPLCHPTPKEIRDRVVFDASAEYARMSLHK